MSQVFTQLFGFVNSSFHDKLCPYCANMWFVKISDILWKSKVQDILKNIEILKICIIVWENISKADQAMM